MNKVKTILIDDEPKAIAILKNKLERLCPELDIVASTQSPEDGISLIKTHKPELIFLDVAMPNLSGFDMLAKIDNPDFEIIFATAYDNYAIKAIQHCAIGYLVKPVDNDDLLITVKNALANIEKKIALAKNNQLIKNLGAQTAIDKKIVIPCQDGYEFAKINDITNLSGDNGYTSINFSNRKPILSSNSIGHFVKILNPNTFYHIHKSHLINLNYITKYLNEGYVVMSDNTKLPVSRNRRQEFLGHLK